MRRGQRHHVLALDLGEPLPERPCGIACKQWRLVLHRPRQRGIENAVNVPASSWCEATRSAVPSPAFRPTSVGRLDRQRGKLLKWRRAERRDQIVTAKLLVPMVGLGADLWLDRSEPSAEPFAHRHPARVHVAAFVKRGEPLPQLLLCVLLASAHRRGRGLPSPGFLPDRLRMKTLVQAGTGGIKSLSHSTPQYSLRYIIPLAPPVPVAPGV